MVLHDYRALQIACKKRKQVWVGMQGMQGLQGTYEQPSTGIAIRWHTKSVIPIAKGAKTCKTIDTSIMIPYNTSQAHDVVQTRCNL